MPFSKKIEYLKAAVALHFGYYIFAGRIRPLTDTVYGGWNHRPCLVSGRTSFLALDDTEPSGREEKGNVFFPFLAARHYLRKPDGTLKESLTS
jgi:hypothetical protein